MARKPNFKKASSAAAAIRRALGSKPPFDPERIAEERDIQVVYAKLKEPYNEKISGFYRKADNKIVINKDISPNRMIFTIAHELGHAVLHQEYIKSKNYQPVFRSNVHVDEKPVEEIEADTFAANFLVPLNILKKYKDVADVGELATMFAVSEDVIENRLDLLRRHPNLATQ
ncbi:ImmA/IrrE family metallo-endopeptidase [Leisingera sp. JC1]|uniref:ImmA/IrrE family metallo-endopeptidase n=1 Tax=Leisingera sp. JC1 TaxID=1855282 RepID=UPI0008030634|nr:ImmA/IrrE family metallo-endopeptidase [Leisingera sp. JC1]OBY24203.1 hypothetical protein A9D60_24615 [Leisingera sp. JC1]